MPRTRSRHQDTPTQPSDVQAAVNPTRQPTPDLAAKKSPSQSRALETFERILGACADLLGEVGIERLSTNLICQRAGISPPALYQYFPNKYAVLHELGQRLMQVQNELLTPWATPATMALPEPEFARSVAEVFLQTVVLTEQMPAGIWVTRALRAVPSLQEVRNRSHDFVTDLLVEPFMQAHPGCERGAARLTFRLAIDALYAAQELLFDDPSLEPAAVAQTMAEMVAGQLMRLRRLGQQA
ncbi:TetR/AcrR family transcriptional regulator [Paucibacter sp. B2R-40]|jgi:AcrR family transcriptional regulator|uniref:TetR/AcrR family transcriptional regulator n=1 Tax=Paucibacter sp. B2R-40 TaxID=2893554 RepID=UPI0021E4DFA8|nr:TetR/AcrR family transcriptional regulator [Paucibacter sp. B2R-40]MCV2356939.1 TetR/AcrR family transcriptional regulator [Paucibacter sp. B2R-40]